jgi:hypothetical protein
MAIAAWSAKVVTNSSGSGPSPSPAKAQLLPSLSRVAITQIQFLEPDVARDVVVFGNMLNGLRIDLKAMALGQMDNLLVSEKTRILENDLKIWRDTQALGRDLIRRLG